MEGTGTQAKQSPVKSASGETRDANKSGQESAIEYQQRIARRAYEFYVERGREEGHADEDWLRAEAEDLNDQH